MSKIMRSVAVASVAAAFGAGSALAAPAAGAQSSFLPGSSAGESDPCGVSVVTPSTLEASGWSSPADETTATIAEVEEATDTVGAAALTFRDESEGGSSLYKDAERMPLSTLLDEDSETLLMNFEYTAEGQAPALQIRLHEAALAEGEEDEAGYDLGFASISWSPDPTDGAWDTADPADSDQFWVTRDLADGEDVVPRGTRMSLNRIIELNPDAVVTEYGVQKTRENTAPGTAIDNFQFGCETTNFELDPEEGFLDGLIGSVTGIFQS